MTPDFFDRIRAFTLAYLETTGHESQQFWNNPTEAEIKSDHSPVTELDKRLEVIFREQSQKNFPEFGVIGEEFGVTNPDAEYRWVIDPIDGTMNLVNRVPTFGTIVSLLRGNKVIYGAIDHPLLGIRHDGGPAIGVYNKSGTKLPAVTPKNLTLDSAVVSAAAPNVFQRSGQTHVLAGLVSHLPNLRIYYDCFSFSMTVQGSMHASVDTGLKIWDVAAAIALMEARGFSVVEWSKTKWTGAADERLSTVMGEKSVVEQLLPILASLNQ